MAFTPLMIQLEDRKAVIIGGGKVACKRARTLIDTGAQVTIVSPHLTSELHAMAENAEVDWKKKTFQPKDIKDAYIVVIATNNELVNEQVWQSSAKVPLVNVTGQAERGNLQFPGHIKRGRLSIAVSTGGASPKLSARMKEELEQKYNHDYEDYVDFLYTCRQYIKRSRLSSEEKQETLKKLVEEDYMDETKQTSMLEWLKQEEEGGDDHEWTAREAGGRSR
ncbi:precorrin-2 dehydrogenase / sirohydrochlorin ferrochelatase [Halobacillus alkaliphilus]|uniref:precorrin-2 dehydrogenase n=1 Tax=Halobacillus alkaliphilus TaxID=396056 RepID=A0A1I2MZG9_9BACI|nr:NAD(P)-binding protein [Halobacillus alkaliphilus]SFF96029.1 precorrin-2 dehydrogenase / sirohydrochlorin ferrochelatase [Halobacillus alkaliphilus]